MLHFLSKIVVFKSPYYIGLLYFINYLIILSFMLSHHIILSHYLIILSFMLSFILSFMLSFILSFILSLYEISKQIRLSNPLSFRKFILALGPNIPPLPNYMDQVSAHHGLLL